MAIWLLYGLALKCFFFYHLDYSSDLFNFLHLSRTWIEKGALLFDSAYGPVGLQHNFYLMLFFYPLTLALGAYGLFVGLYFFFAAAVFFYLHQAVRFLPRSEIIIFLALLLGPVGFWLFDHPTWGWHLELMYLPLSLFVSVFLIRGKARGALLTALVFLLIKEDGALLALCLFLAWEFLRDPQVSPLSFDYARRKKVLRIMLFWGVLFVAGLALLVIQNRFLQEPEVNSETLSRVGLNSFKRADLRISKSVSHLFEQLKSADGLLRNFSMIFFSYALIFSASLCAGWSRAKKIFPVFLVFSFPLLLVNLISSAAYPEPLWGLTWPPRFVEFWALFLAVFIYIQRQEFKRISPLWIILSLFMQITILKIDRNYNFLERVFAPQKTTVSLNYPPEVLREIRCLSDSLPSRKSVILAAPLYGIFHFHDILVRGQTQGVFSEPVLSICHVDMKDPVNLGCQESAAREKTWEHVFRAPFEISYSPEIKDQVNACLKLDPSEKR